MRFRSGRTALAKALAHAQVRGVARARFRVVPELELVTLPAEVSVREAIRGYQSNPDVLYAEPDYLVFPDDSIPNDPFFSLTWGLLNTGLFGGQPGADIGATKAWDLSTGSKDVVVGIIDTGMAYRHPDLEANVFRNEADCNSNQIDDDNNGYPDDCHGINARHDDAVWEPWDWIGHGTHVSGTIGAVGNNALGVAGVNWTVSMIPCKFIGWDGGLDSGAIECLDYMAALKDRGVNIVATNNSWGGGFYSQALKEAIQGQLDRGILFVAAAGNDSLDHDINFHYPSSYDVPNIISVGASDRGEQLATFSDFGRHSVHLAAPGVGVLSTYGYQSYEYLDGTSMATPHVTGAAALLKSYLPALDWKALKNRLLTGGDTTASAAETITQKRLNVYGAMVCTDRGLLARVQPRNTTSTTVNSHVRVSMIHINCAEPAGEVNVTVAPTGQVLTLHDDGLGPDEIAGDGTYSAEWIPSKAGVFTLQFPSGDEVLIQVLRGYLVVDTEAAYRTISGTNLQLGDEDTKEVHLPFPIRFGGQQFDRIFVSSNGIITFDHAFNLPVGLRLPSQEVGTLVAPFWDDLYPVAASDSNVFWDVLGSTPNREVVVEWRDVGTYDYPPGTVKFQVVFFENTDDVLFNYTDVFVDGYYGRWSNYGGYASVGIQVGPDAGSQFSYYEEKLKNGMSLRFVVANTDFILDVTTPVIIIYPGQTASYKGTAKAVRGLPAEVSISCTGAFPAVCGTTTVQPTTEGAPFSVAASDTHTGQFDFELEGRSSNDVVPLVHKYPVTLKVVDYSVAAAPASLTIPNGGTATATIQLTASGPFDDSVKLSCSGLPQGATCSFESSTPKLTGAAPVSVPVTIALAPHTAVADYQLTIMATALTWPATRTQVVPLTVAAHPDFLLSAPALAIGQGAAPATVTVTLDPQDGYSSTVNMTCAVAPVGPACMISPSAISTFPSAATLNISNGAANTSYTVTVTGTDGSNTHAVTLAYRIVDYTVTVPATFIAYPYIYNSFYFRVDPQNGFNGKVNLTCDATALQARYCTVNPGQVNFAWYPSYSASVSFYVPPEVLSGTYPVVIATQDPDGGPARQFTVSVTVRGFTFNVGEHHERTVLVGQQSEPFDLVFTPYNGYDLKTSVNSWGGLADTTFDFSPSNSITPSGEPVTISMRAMVSGSSRWNLGGTHSIAIMASAGTGSDTVQTLVKGDLILHVQDFWLDDGSDNPYKSLMIFPGHESTQAFTLKEYEGLDVPVVVNCPAELPPGITCRSDKPEYHAGDTVRVTFAAAPDASLGYRTITISAVAAAGDKQIKHEFDLKVSIATFTLEVTPSTLTVPEGGEGIFFILPNAGYADPYTPLEVSCSNLAAGITCEPPLSITFGNYASVRVRTTPGVTTVGSHPFTIGVTAAGETQSVTPSIVMQGPNGLIVTAPNGYELWTKGPQLITWKYSGDPGNVRLELWKKGAFDRVIASNLPVGADGKGSYAWAIPDSLPFSPDYRIRAASERDSSINDISDNPVWIGKGVQILSPNGGETFYLAGNYFLIVHYTWSGMSNVRLDLYRGDQLLKTIAGPEGSGYYNAGNYEWDIVGTIPYDLAPGNDYRARLVTVDDESRSDFTDGPFTITQLPKITVISPNGGEVWRPGSQQTVKWTYTPDNGRDVSIGLSSGGYGVRLITPTTSIGANGSGSYTWTVPADLTPGQLYRVSISSFAPNGGADASDFDFAIGDFHSVTITLDGNGTVTSYPEGINCGDPYWPKCSSTFVSGTTVSLVAHANQGSKFNGWSGACSGTGNCTLTMNGDYTAKATFAVQDDPNFSMSITPNGAIVRAGSSSQHTITITPAGNLSSTVTLSCSGLPVGATCVFERNNFVPNASAVASTLTITTTGGSAGLQQTGIGSLLAAIVPVLALCLWIPVSKGGSSVRVRRKMMAIGSTFILLLSVLLLACGGSPPPSRTVTPPGSYAITVLASTGATQHSAQINLTVQ